MKKPRSLTILERYCLEAIAAKSTAQTSWICHRFSKRSVVAATRRLHRRGLIRIQTDRMLWIATKEGRDELKKPRPPLALEFP